MTLTITPEYGLLNLMLKCTNFELQIYLVNYITDKIFSDLMIKYNFPLLLTIGHPFSILYLLNM